VQAGLQDWYEQPQLGRQRSIQRCLQVGCSQQVVTVCVQVVWQLSLQPRLKQLPRRSLKRWNRPSEPHELQPLEQPVLQLSQVE
jgi:hypothetical protein